MSDINETTRLMLRSTALAIAERDQVPPGILHVISARDLLLGALMQEYNSLMVGGLAVDVAPAPSEPVEILVGSDLLPAQVEIASGHSVALGDIVSQAHAKSGLAADEWNALASTDREALLSATIDELKAAVEPEVPVPATEAAAPDVTEGGGAEAATTEAAAENQSEPISAAVAEVTETETAPEDVSTSRRKRGGA